MRVAYTPTFLRQLGSLEPDLRDEAIEAVKQFEDLKNHKLLRVHKLKGRLLGRYSFSVNYKTRIIFLYLTKDEVVLLAIGDHDVYR